MCHPGVLESAQRLPQPFGRFDHIRGLPLDEPPHADDTHSEQAMQLQPFAAPLADDPHRLEERRICGEVLDVAVREEKLCRALQSRSRRPYSCRWCPPCLPCLLCQRVCPPRLRLPTRPPAYHKLLDAGCCCEQLLEPALASLPSFRPRRLASQSCEQSMSLLPSAAVSAAVVETRCSTLIASNRASVLSPPSAAPAACLPPR